MDSCLLQTMQVKQLRWKTLLRALRTRSLGEMPCAQPAHLVPKRLQTQHGLSPGASPVSHPPEALTSSHLALASEKPPFPHLSIEIPIPSSLARVQDVRQISRSVLGTGTVTPRSGLFGLCWASSNGHSLQPSGRPRAPQVAPRPHPTSLPARPGLLLANSALEVVKHFKPGRPALDHFSALPPGSLTVCWGPGRANEPGCRVLAMELAGAALLS